MIIVIVILAAVIGIPAWIAWSIHKRTSGGQTPLTLPPSDESPTGRETGARLTLLALILTFAAGAIAYRLLKVGHLEYSAALFVGLPVVLAAAVVFGNRAVSLRGLVLKGVTIALLLSGPLLNEGFVCVVMAAPLFYMVAILVAIVLEWTRDRVNDWRDRRAYGIALLPFMLLSLEGTHPVLMLPSSEEVVVERTVTGSAAEVERKLGQSPDLTGELPPFLRIFPKPSTIHAEGLSAGDRWIVAFRTPSGKTKDLVLQVTERGERSARFSVRSDDSKIAEWLGWQDSEVRWEERSEGRTSVQWTFRYERRLSPSWYFGPLERYAVQLAGEYLIRTAAAPDGLTDD